MRLIDAEVIKMPTSIIHNVMGCYMVRVEDVQRIISDQATAFDKEKVIKELKEMETHSKECKNQCSLGSTEYFDYMGSQTAYRVAIEIVEKGGIE